MLLKSDLLSLSIHVDANSSLISKLCDKTVLQLTMSNLNLSRFAMPSSALYSTPITLSSAASDSVPTSQMLTELEWPLLPTAEPVVPLMTEPLLSSSAAQVVPQPTELEVPVKEVDRKAQRAEVRRVRNRAYAARSNAERKRRTDALKADLRDVHAAEEKLRTLEQVLRAENARLRKLVSI